MDPSSSEDNALIKYRDQAKELYGEEGTSTINWAGTGKSKAKINIIGTKSFTKEVRKQLLKLSRGSNDFKKMMTALADKGVEVDILLSTSAATLNTTGPSGGGNSIIAYSAFQSINYGLSFINSKEVNVSGTLSPRSILAHELYHSGQISGSNYFNRSGGKQGWEDHATFHTNQVRLQMGGTYIRQYYKGLY